MIVLMKSGSCRSGRRPKAIQIAEEGFDLAPTESRWGPPALLSATDQDGVRNSGSPCLRFATSSTARRAR